MRIYLARVRKGGELRAYAEPVTRTVVYTTPAVYAPAPVYVAAPVYAAPPPVVVAAPPPPPQPTVVQYPHGQYELRRPRGVSRLPVGVDPEFAAATSAGSPGAGAVAGA